MENIVTIVSTQLSHFNSSCLNICVEMGLGLPHIFQSYLHAFLLHAAMPSSYRKTATQELDDVYAIFMQKYKKSKGFANFQAQETLLQIK